MSDRLSLETVHRSASPLSPQPSASPAHSAQSSRASSAQTSQIAHLLPASPATTPRSPAKGDVHADDGDVGSAAALRARVAALEARLQLADARNAMWEECMRALVGSVLLGPEMNQMYRDFASELMSDALGSLEQIQTVRYVECSFPSVPAESPVIKMKHWDSLSASEWSVEWKPSWSMAIALEGSHYVSFKLLVRITDFRIAGSMCVDAAADLSSISISFASMPTFELNVDCSVTWGSLALPIQAYIESTVKEEFARFVEARLVAPNAMTICPSCFQPRSDLSDSDVQKAAQAAALARELTEVESNAQTSLSESLLSSVTSFFG